MENTKERLQRLLETDTWFEEDRLWLQQYLNGKDLSELRALALEQYREDLTELKNVLDKKLSVKMLAAIHQRIRIQQPVPFYKSATLLRIAASIIFILSAISIYFLLRKPTGSQLAVKKTQAENPIILPGSNKAILTLADGSKSR